MGAVYLAEHPEIGRRVAVKVLRPELIKDPQLLLRFLNEARAANAIRHPNIIEILDSGTTSDGIPYLVMELLEGEVLSARIRRAGKLSLPDTLQFCYQTASALAAAHAKGIIHRDLKPDNLFIVPDPVDPLRERIKVLDFGIAKLQDLSVGRGVSSGAGMQTRTGTLLGTPVYMSPEQCLGTKTLDARSDVYALGIIMFEMLTGHPPFISEGFGELVNMHLNVVPRPLRDIDATIPPLVAAMVARALGKAPEARQASAVDLQKDIREAAGDEIEIRGLSSRHVTSTTNPRAMAGSAGGTQLAAAARDGFSLASANTTTMSSGAGERAPIAPRSARGAAESSSSGRRLIVAAMAAAIVATVVLAVFRRQGRVAEPDPPADAAGGSPSAISPFRLTVDSRPSGAEVIDVESGKLLGRTPFVIERLASEGPVAVRVEKPGFVPATHAFDVDRDRVETVSLVPAPEPAVAPDPDAAPAGVPASNALTRPKKAHRPRRQSVQPDQEPAKL